MVAHEKLEKVCASRTSELEEWGQNVIITFICILTYFIEMASKHFFLMTIIFSDSYNSGIICRDDTQLNKYFFNACYMQVSGRSYSGETEMMNYNMVYVHLEFIS